MDLKKMLPLILKDRLGEREKMLLRLTESNDAAETVPMLMQMLEQNKKTPRKDIYATFKKIIPAETLGVIIKYLNEKK